MSRAKSTTWSLLLIAAILLVAWFAPIQWAFIGTMALMVTFCVMLGIVICKQPLGILISEQNVISLSRFQTGLWTVILISGFLVIAMARIKNGVLAGDDSAALGDPLNIIFGKELLGLLGITAGSLVGSQVVSAVKKSKTPAPDAVEKTAKELVRLNKLPESIAPVNSASSTTKADSKTTTELRAETSDAITAIAENAEGLLYTNPTAGDASFTDMFEGNEVGNAAHVDLTKVQMFFFTMAVATAYVYGLWDIISTDAIYGPDFTFPSVSSGLVGVLGISNFGYLSGKAVDHTPKS
jgi:hypothetical protein